MSNGTYVVKVGDGVQWNTLAPFPSELTVKADEISSKQGDTVVFRLDAKTEPGVRMITSLLFSLLAGNLKMLSSEFTSTGEVAADGWKATLLPKSPALQKVFTRITLSGDRAVRTVEIIEGSGDTTDISLTPDGP